MERLFLYSAVFVDFDLSMNFELKTATSLLEKRCQITSKKRLAICIIKGEPAKHLQMKFSKCFREVNFKFLHYMILFGFPDSAVLYGVSEEDCCSPRLSVSIFHGFMVKVVYYGLEG
ncbi:hypothetical protein Tsubulata_042053 [Turnera subulata]|uniref:Uncharacterized protein n=1 Tax=Turnera subulata TaxID=218843 RepID=A0A9Q0FNE6_9ROSI|nr:hypothetical protein Tsubulata_042053 [Turnera subulata]